MGIGFLTIEQWKARGRIGAGAWVAVSHLDAGRSMSDALREIEVRGTPGYFRVIQTQRMVWAERIDGKLRLRKWHANSRTVLMRGAKAFVRDKGRWPKR